MLWLDNRKNCQKLSAFKRELTPFSVTLEYTSSGSLQVCAWASTIMLSDMLPRENNLEDLFQVKSILYRISVGARETS